MKSLYLCGLVAGLLWLGLVMFITFATPPDEGLAMRLQREPDKWELRVTEESYSLKKAEEQKYNELLRQFISRNHGASMERLSQANWMVVISAFFCLVGWLREKAWQKKFGTANLR